MIYLLDTNAAIALLKEQPQMLNHVRPFGEPRHTDRPL